LFSGWNPTLDTMAVPYVINLDRSPERWEALQRDWKGAFPVQRVSAVEASPGWVGCGLSHVKVVEEAKARGDKWVLVWEDDCIPRKRNGEYTNVQLVKRIWDHTLEVLSRNMGQWDVILGATSQVFDRPMMDKGMSTSLVQLFRVNKGFTTHWTLYNQSFFDKILEWGKTRPEQIDVYIFKKARVFVTRPFLAEQRPCYSLIENRETDYSPFFDRAEKEFVPNALPFVAPSSSKRMSVATLVPVMAAAPAPATLKLLSRLLPGKSTL